MNQIAGKKVFVTGAGGFIGSHLSSYLVRLGADVTAMLHYNSRSDWSNLEFLPDDERSSLRIVRGNVEDSAFMDRHIKGQQIVFQTNFGGCELAENQCRIIIEQIVF